MASTRDARNHIAVAWFAAIFLLAAGGVIAAVSWPSEEVDGGSDRGILLGAVVAGAGAVVLLFAVTAVAVVVGNRATRR